MFESPGALDGLNDEQRRAAAHPGGPLLVLAGAGTGKTRTLVARAAWLCEQGVPPPRVLLLTFTRRAADDMLSRAAAGTRPAGGRITGGTFHAIAHRIIRQHAESFSLPPQFTVIDPADVTDLLDARRADHGLAGTQRRAPRAGACADIYTRCVNAQKTVTEVVRAEFPWCHEYTGQLGELFGSYVAHKRGHGLVDFDDLLLLWRAALADPAAGPVLRGMFDAVLVDEYQDVNTIQADIVRLLMPDGGCLTCVGDDAQAIYGFRGADPQHLRELAVTFPGLTVVRLGRNYRSLEAVLRLANAVRPQSSGLELALTADREAGAAPVLVRCYDEATQAREICAQVLEACEAGGRDLRDQAVLVRTAHHSDVLEIELAARGIPFVKYGGLRFTEAAHVKDFLAAARIVANPADDIAWFRVLRLHEGVGTVTARRVLDVLDPAQPGPFGRWPAAADAVPRRARENLTATITSLGAAAGDDTPQRAASILAALEGPLRARYPDAGVRLADLQRLADAAASRPSLHDALVELALDPPVSASDLAGPPRVDEDFLVISTVHSAKGLEWPVVHLPQLVDGAVPSDMALGSPGGLAEEQRLFYVAVTRARDHLYLYAPMRLHHHRLASDDRHGYGQLTRFLSQGALAACETIEAAPPAPLLPATAQLRARIDADLSALWTG
jgi:DNA helicase-2/ATP-dependent DNA helicase PcrA